MERKTQIKGIRKGLAGVLLGALALANPAQAQEGWFNLQPAYNLKTESPTLRLEGGATLDKKFDVYGFLDLDSNKEGSADLDNYFGKLRFTYSLGDLSDKLENVGIAAEYTTASGMEDIIRPQLTYKTSLFKDNSTTFRFSPCDINGEGGPALNLFSYQQINKDISVQLLADYNLESQTAYIEPEIDYKISEKASLFLQGRSFGELNQDLITNMTPVIGIKIKF